MTLLNVGIVQAQSTGECTSNLTVVIPKVLKINSITSPVLTANITDRTGNLHSPLNTTFRVITNTSETETLYLQANAVTESGYEPAMFAQGGQVYIAFTNLKRTPTSQSLMNCKMGGMPKDSPGVVAYPITSIIGAKTKYVPSKQKYEVYVKNGITDISVNVGSNVLRSSFE